MNRLKFKNPFPVLVALGFLSLTACRQTADTVSVDGSRKLQKIDGFGVNANTASWGDTKLIPAIDLLVDSLNANIWRVVVESQENWESENDNDDPFSFNWDYYNRLYETPKFQKAWDMIAYLNKKGIKDNLIISIMGGIPEWMGRDTINPSFENEFVEMHTSFIYYALRVRHLKFGLYSPVNETDLHNVQIEGPHTGPQQFGRILKKMVVRLDSMGLYEVNLVTPDLANMNKAIDSYLPVILNDSVVMSRVNRFGFHSYGGYYAPVDSFICSTKYQDIPWWMTEFNAWRDGLDHGETGIYDYNYAGECVDYLLQLIQHGSSACIVWEGYDSPYEHHGAMSYWGILGLDQKSGTYYPRKHFFALAQVFKFIPAGARQLGISGNTIPMLAFAGRTSDYVCMVGINKKSTAVKLKIKLEDLPVLNEAVLYYTDSTKNLFRENEVKLTGGVLETRIPADCIFTITGHK